MDLATGLLYIVPGGGIADDTALEVDYDTAARTIEVVTSSNTFGDLLEADGAGMNDAVAATRELTALMQDPATVAGMNAITAAVVKLAGAMARAVTGIASFTKGIAEIIGVASGFNAGKSVLASILHSGGIACGPAPLRSAPALAFAGAPRFQGGGEVPAILQRGEEVLTANDRRHRRNGAA